MRFYDFCFGSLQINDVVYEHDVVVDRGKIRKRDKKPSKKFRDEFAHTPLSIREEYRGSAVGSLWVQVPTVACRL